MFAHKIFGKCCKTQKNNFWKFFAELVLLFRKMFYNRGTKSMRTSAMQNKAHNFPPYHIGNAPRRKLRGVSFFASRISFAGAKQIASPPCLLVGARRSPPCLPLRGWWQPGGLTDGVKRRGAPALRARPASHIVGAFLRELSSEARLRESPYYSLPCVRGGGLPKARRKGC